jgi:hypothetical protein
MSEKLHRVIKKARRRGAVSGLRCLIRSKMLQYFLDHTFSITPGSSIAAMIYRAAFRIAATFIALLNFY